MSIGGDINDLEEVLRNDMRSKGKDKKNLGNKEDGMPTGLMTIAREKTLHDEFANLEMNEV